MDEREVNMQMTKIFERMRQNHFKLRENVIWIQLIWKLSDWNQFVMCYVGEMTSIYIWCAMWQAVDFWILCTHSLHIVYSNICTRLHSFVVHLSRWLCLSLLNGIGDADPSFFVFFFFHDGMKRKKFVLKKMHREHMKCHATKRESKMTLMDEAVIFAQCTFYSFYSINYNPHAL